MSASKQLNLFQSHHNINRSIILSYSINVTRSICCAFVAYNQCMISGHAKVLWSCQKTCTARAQQIDSKTNQWSLSLTSTDSVMQWCPSCCTKSSMLSDINKWRLLVDSWWHLAAFVIVLRCFNNMSMTTVCALHLANITRHGKLFSKFTVWDKVPEGSSLIFNTCPSRTI